MDKQLLDKINSYDEVTLDKRFKHVYPPCSNGWHSKLINESVSRKLTTGIASYDSKIRIGDKLYYFCGSPNPIVPFSDCEVVDVNTNVSTPILSYPEKVFWLGLGFDGNDSIYCIGGVYHSSMYNINKCYKYSISKNSYSNLPNFPINIYRPRVFFFKNKIYVHGGVTNTSSHYGLYRLTDDGLNWSYISSLNYNCGLAVTPDEIYVSASNQGLYKFNPETALTTKVSDLFPTLVSVVYKNNRMYTYGLSYYDIKNDKIVTTNMTKNEPITIYGGTNEYLAYDEEKKCFVGGLTLSCEIRQVEIDKVYKGQTLLLQSNCAINDFEIVPKDEFYTVKEDGVLTCIDSEFLGGTCWSCYKKGAN